jgi:NAD(P)-dependent dehydrogenase (short-subunit alcohol dehydrogenase family)
MSVDYDRSAVITGAASGIGRELSLVYARRGWRIGLVDINMDEAAKTLEIVEEAGGSGETFKCNVREFDQVQAMADHFLDGWGKVGLLVNNAGVAAAGPVGDMPLQEWRRVMETNFWGVVYGCHTFVPRMKEQGAGHILNIGSIAGIAPIPEMPSYNTAKAGVISLSETLRIELAPLRNRRHRVMPVFPEYQHLQQHHLHRRLPGRGGPGGHGQRAHDRGGSGAAHGGGGG